MSVNEEAANSASFFMGKHLRKHDTLYGSEISCMADPFRLGVSNPWQVQHMGWKSP